jgi:ribosomal protein RSM22 (predicted rRNA methylase)
MIVPKVAQPPASLLAAIDALAEQRLGADNLHGAALARAVQRVSDAYRRQDGSPRTLESDPRVLCARLKFFLPRDFPKIQAPLRELASVGALPRASELRVLDIGAGLGTTGLGAAAYALALPGIDRIRIDAVDANAEALELAQLLCLRWATAAGLDIGYATHRAPLTAGLLERLRPPYHMIVLGFVLNELGDDLPDATAHHHAWLMRLSRLLSDDGVLVVLEPALREHCRVLQAVRGLLVASAGPPYVFAPCLHRQACPLLVRERDFCHERLPLPLPPALAPIARAAGLRDSDLSYSYLTLHKAERSLAELDPDIPLHRVISAPLGSKGKIEIGVCGSGSVEKLRRLDRHASAENDALLAAGRGTVLRIADARNATQQVLALATGTRIECVLDVAAEA